MITDNGTSQVANDEPLMINKPSVPTGVRGRTGNPGGRAAVTRGMNTTPRAQAAILLIGAIIVLLQAAWAATLAVASGEPLIWLVSGTAAAAGVWLLRRWLTMRRS
ncbi:hypothetical protein [Actinoallomurus iriomotensis]|uniref:Uncharacterized protein n=2 Tax=Actinoallomurus iriomotensis TaxID=478107 RepID=A0A9W6RM87_9ACTN|nr:hypothetical protein [Actinoallomurus iriomotensis]GLY76420.1 hypothetical protein Airi01_046870 [Actinoallomurus iriomotensis]